MKMNENFHACVKLLFVDKKKTILPCNEPIYFASKPPRYKRSIYNACQHDQQATPSPHPWWTYVIICANQSHVNDSLVKMISWVKKSIIYSSVVKSIHPYTGRLVLSSLTLSPWLWEIYSTDWSLVRTENSCQNKSYNIIYNRELEELLLAPFGLKGLN